MSIRNIIRITTVFLENEIILGLKNPQEITFIHLFLFIDNQGTLPFTISWSLLKLMSLESMMLSNRLILCCPPLLLPSVFPSIKVFSNELALCIRWQNYWIFSISPFNEYSGLIYFRIDWFDLLAVQGTLKSLLQHHNLKKSIFIIQPSSLHTGY